jgi:hypothetical protein
MKLNFKTLCINHGINFYGNGKYSEHCYLYKLCFINASIAFISDKIDGRLPLRYLINGKYILFFPNMDVIYDKKSMSVVEFNSIIKWIEDGLSGNIYPFNVISNLKVIGPTS